MRQANTAAGKPYSTDEGTLAGAETLRALGVMKKPAFDLRSTWAMIYRNRVAILLIVAASLLVGLASILFTPRTYRAVASVQIDQQTGKAPGDEIAELSGNDHDVERFLQTHVDVLRSRAMARRVANRLGLAKSDDFLAAAGKSLFSEPTPAEREELVLDWLQKNLTVDLKPMSRVVGIVVDAHEPETAARLANTYSEEFIHGNMQRRLSAGDYSRQLLQNQIGMAKDRLEASERSLISYARAARMIDPGKGALVRGDANSPRSLAADNLVQLNAALMDAKATRLKAQQRWEQARDVSAATLPEVLENAAVQQLLQKRAELNAQVAEMRQHMTANHPMVLRTGAQIGELDREMRGLTDSIRDSIRNQYLTAQRQEEALGAQVDALKADSLSEQDLGMRYNILRREVDTNRQMYTSLLQRSKDLNTQTGVTNNITVVDRADVPASPISPRPLLNMALSLLIGVILALLYAYARDKLDDAIRDPRDVENKLHLPLLGVVPEFTGSNLKETLEAPYSEVAEAYHAVRSSVELSSNKGLPPSLLITSSNKGEGKSTTSYVLARDLARLGRRVLLIDADIRQPALHRYFDVPSGAPGLSSALAKLVPANEAIRPAKDGAPAFMASGPLPPDPAGLLAGTAVQDLLAELAADYDVIVVDGPPVMALADAVALSSATEATIFVVEAGAAHFGQARTAVSRLARGRGNLIGCVVTKYNARKVGYTEDQDYYSYGYSKDA